MTPDDPMDLDSGANTLQNFPVLSSASTRNGATTVTGSLNSRPSSTYRIDFFASPFDSSGAPAEGARFLGAISLSSNANGDGTFKAVLPTGVSPGEVITATATDSSNNSSEFSQGVRAIKGDLAAATLPIVHAFSPSPSATRESLIASLTDDRMDEELI